MKVEPKLGVNNYLTGAEYVGSTKIDESPQISGR